MSAWHDEAEQWALQTVKDAASVLPVFLTPALAPATVGLGVFVGPASMETADIRSSGAASADMRVTVTVRGAGDLPADHHALTLETDAIGAALIRAGARSLSTTAGVLQAVDAANPLPARTITATVAIEGAC